MSELTEALPRLEKELEYLRDNPPILSRFCDLSIIDTEARAESSLYKHRRALDEWNEDCDCLIVAIRIAGDEIAVQRAMRLVED